jgi:hypothetical protein
MTTKRTPRERHRKAPLLIDDPAVKLFARLERVPVPRRMGYAYRDHAMNLARMLGLASEHWLDAHQLNDPSSSSSSVRLSTIVSCNHGKGFWRRESSCSNSPACHPTGATTLSLTMSIMITTTVAISTTLARRDRRRRNTLRGRPPRHERHRRSRQA